MPLRQREEPQCNVLPPSLVAHVLHVDSHVMVKRESAHHHAGRVGKIETEAIACGRAKSRLAAGLDDQVDRGGLAAQHEPQKLAETPMSDQESVAQAAGMEAVGASELFRVEQPAQIENLSSLDVQPATHDVHNLRRLIQ